MDAAADDDRGHRYGNFPNYYSFHPPRNRLWVLERANILDYIRNGLTMRPYRGDGGTVFGDDDDDGGENWDGRSELGIGGDDRDGGAVVASGSASDAANECRSKKRRRGLPPSAIYYCDLGCNEGDLTMAMAATLANKISPIADESSPSVANEESMQSSGGDENDAAVRCLGLDLDPKLIERANCKFCNREGSKLGDESTTQASHDNVNAMFKTCNLRNESDHNSACSSFTREILSNTSKEDNRTATTITKSITKETPPGQGEALPQPMFHLTTIFSTTMWIHVHGGDEGLQEFLERACAWTGRFLLIEPQPSGCYRKANIRLRKMGLPELEDVTSSRLRMRPEIEREIETVVLGRGFRRVVSEDMLTLIGSGTKRDDAVTSWNRTLHLYERVHC